MCSTENDTVFMSANVLFFSFMLQAHLIKNCSLEDLPCPFVMVEQVGFEMQKKYRETKLQLLLSPVVLRSGGLSPKRRSSAEPDNNHGSGEDEDLNQGHLLLTGLQFRGHAMFSDLDRPLGSETLEYAWLIEIQCGSLIGKSCAFRKVYVLYLFFGW